MNRTNDLEAYFKKALEGLTEQPTTYAWSILSDKLEKREQIKKRRALYVKMALVLTALLSGFQFTSDRDIMTTVSRVGIIAADMDSNVEKMEEKATLKPMKSISKKPKVSNRGNGKDKPLEKDVRNVSKSNPIGALDPSLVKDPSKNVENQTNQESISERDASRPKDQVTEAEIETLMWQAKQNREQEKRRLLEQKMMAHQMLAEMEREMQAHSHKGFYNNVKQGFKKFKTVIAN